MGAIVVDTLNPLLLGRVLGSLEADVRAQGLLIEFGEDFDVFETMVRTTKKGELTEHFRTALNTYTPESAFWVRCFTPDGETVAVGAARLDELGSWTLDRYLRQYWARCYPSADGEGAMPAKEQPRFMREITGRVAYFGDLWVDAKWQRKGVHKSMSLLAIFYAAVKWRPDWFYCWIRPSHWSKRYPMAYGYSCVHPAGIRWDRSPTTIDDDLVMAVNKWSWVADWLDHLAARLPVE